MVKYKEYLQKMLDDNKQVFDEFTKLHEKYDSDEEKWQKEFNEKGSIVMDIVQEYENRLCANTERGMYSVYSAKLAEKFRDEIRKIYPLIDHIGITVVTKKAPLTAPDFSLKKISPK